MEINKTQKWYFELTKSCMYSKFWNYYCIWFVKNNISSMTLLRKESVPYYPINTISMEVRGKIANYYDYNIISRRGEYNIMADYLILPNNYKFEHTIFKSTQLINNFILIENYVKVHTKNDFVLKKFLNLNIKTGWNSYT